MLTIGVIGIVGVILAVWFKTIKPEYGIMISVVAFSDYFPFKKNT